MGDEDKKSGDLEEVLKMLFIYSLKVGIEYGKELLEREEAGKDEALGLINDTLKKILQK